MNERVVEILVYIMSQIRGRNGNLNELEVISQDLLNRGYSQNDISSAFSWLLEKFKNNIEEIVKNSGPTSAFSFRILHELEQMIITPEAYGYVLQLKALELLDDFDVEQIIERTMMLGTTHIDIPQIKAIIASVISQNNGSFESDVLSTDDDSPVIN